MNFKQQIAKYVTGNLTTDQLSNVGLTGLEEGLDTPSLRILAGLSKNENPLEIKRYFHLALKELNIELPNERQAALEFAIALINEILAGKLEIIKGITEIIYKAFSSHDFSPEDKQYCYDSIGFDTIYGLYDTYEELAKADIRWEKNKTNKELMIEVKEKLLSELQKWKKQMKTEIS